MQGTASVLVCKLGTIAYTLYMYAYLVSFKRCIGCVYALHWLHLRVTLVAFMHYIGYVYALCLLRLRFIFVGVYALCLLRLHVMFVTFTWN